MILQTNTDRSSKVSALQIMMDNKQSHDGSSGGRSYQNLGRLTFVVLLICISPFYFGFSLTYLSTIPSQTLVNSFGQKISNPTVNAFLVGAVPIGAIFGSLLANPMMQVFTRRNMILFINIMVLVVNIIIQIPNIVVLFVCRILSGIFVGIYLGIVPIYIHELCPHSVSGSFGAFTQLSHIFGVVISYLIGMIFNLTDANGSIFFWRFMFSFTSILVLIQTVLFLIHFVPQSPNSLIQNNEISKAKKVLSMFHNQDPKKIEQLVQQKKLQNQQLQIDQTISINETLTVDKIVMTCKSGFLGFELPLLQQISGINFIVTYLGQLTSQYDPPLQAYSALVANVIEFSATALSILVLVRVGRKPSLLLGNIGVGIINIVIGIIFLFINSWAPSFTVILALIGVFMVVFGFTLGPVVWLYVPQILPTKMVPIATAMNWMACSFCVVVPPIIISIMGTPYLIFLILGVIQIFFFFVPNLFWIKETKGLAPYQINAKFKK